MMNIAIIIIIYGPVLTTGLSHLPAFYIAKDWYRGYMVEEINLYIE